MPHKWRVLIADDHAIVRQGLKLLIDSQSDMEVVGEAADGAAVLEQASVVRPDVVIMDISIEVHKTSAMRKLGLNGRVEVIRYGVLQGWLYDT